MWFTGWLFLILASAPVGANPPSPKVVPQPTASFFESKLGGLTDNIPELLLKTVNEKIAGHISAKNFDYEAPSTVTLYGVKITDPDGASVVSVRQLKIALSVKALFSGNLLFEEITIREPTINLKSQDGKLNIERAFKTKTKATSSKDDEAPFQSMSRYFI